MKKLTATQKRLIEVYEKAQVLKNLYKNKGHFDFSCLNDYCSGKNGIRVVAMAWKSSNGYSVFCSTCGQLEEVSVEDFKKKKIEIDKEKAHYNMEQERLKHKK